MKTNTTKLATTNSKELNTDFTTQEKKRFATLTQTISKAQGQANSLARTIAGALAEIQDKKLYSITHKTFEEYCKDVHGIAKSTAFESTKTFRRFKSPDAYQIDEKYDKYPWRSLTSMVALDDYEIENLNLLQCKTGDEVKATIRDYKTIKDKLAPNWKFEDAKALVKEAKQKSLQKAIDDKAGETNSDEVVETTDKPEITVEEVSSESNITVYNMSTHAWDVDMLAEYIAMNLEAIKSGMEIVVKA